jgi:glycosyltransferase involved in cell wall biosynthesis
MHHPLPQPAPHVSVVMATYNRSNIVHHAIQSVLRQTLTDLELIVVGDACTDDTEAVVRSFDDPRVRFVNLERNIGEQSGPNNHGLGLARGSLIAFLNHDDLWFEDHLERAVQHLETTEAGLVWTLGMAVLPDGTPRLLGVSRTTRYAPHVLAVASTWLVRREVVNRVGPWHSAKQVYATPSQDWLYRAHRLGVDMRLCPHVTMLAIQSGNRRNSYRDRQFLEHEHHAIKMKNPRYREELLARIALEREAGFVSPFASQDLKFIRNKVFFTFCQIFRLHPVAVWAWVKFRSRGGVIRYLRRVRGLEQNQ